jgi:hypothetical protein
LIPERKIAIYGLIVLFANIAGALWAFFGVHFIASNVGLFTGGAYGALCALLFWISAAKLRLERRTALVTSLVIGVFGLFAFSHTAASVFTSATGIPSIKVYKVSASYFTPGGRYRSCYEHQLSGVLWLAISRNLLCTESAVSVGSSLSVIGPISVFGQIAAQVNVTAGP